MSNSKQTTEKPASEQAILKALAANPEATAAEVAAAAGVGRSTASKVLARLASTEEVCRTEGGRDGARRLPDRFALASAEPAAKTAKPKAAANSQAEGAWRASEARATRRARPRLPEEERRQRPSRADAPSRGRWSAPAAQSATASSG